MQRTKKDAMGDYEPLAWDADSVLGAEERATIENQRRDLWSKGLRGETLERLAFEFAAVICMQRAARKAGFRA